MSDQIPAPGRQRSSALVGAAKTGLWLCVFLAFGWLVVGQLFKGKPDPAATRGAAAGESWMVGEENKRVQELSRQYQAINFGLLSDYYYYSPDPWETPDPSLVRKSRIPDDIKALHGRQVALSGFMMPLTQGADGAREFVLNGSYDMCGFGGPVAVNQWAMVRYVGKGAVPFTHLPLTVFGRLEVGEDRKDGHVQSLYRIQAAAVSLPGGVVE
ncbi:MAG: DUF3299 domain-containing protein [Blastocatellia bacterium]|nr:DUF3299 domain-containing protein [Blastocatellia bacterium]